MKKLLISLLSLLALAGCSLLAPYTVTFTTPAHSAVDPFTDTLDLALSQPAMAYISEVDCEGSDPVAILPVVNSNMESNIAHNLSLNLLDAYEATTECDVRVTVFDQSTTATTSANISLYVLEKPAIAIEYEEEMLACSEAEGEWNACGSSCDEGDDFCVQVCVPQCEFAEEILDEEVIEELVEEDVTEEPVVEEPDVEEALEEEVLVEKITQELCVAAEGQWNVSCDEENVCEQWCDE
jgi:hypothetical protein